MHSSRRSAGAPASRCSDRVAEGQDARERLVQHDAERVPVGRLGQRAPERLLGRHVPGGAAVVGLLHEADGPRQPEIEQDDAVVTRRDQEVRRLQIAVERPRVVKDAQRDGELPEDVANEDLLGRPRPRTQRGERDALDEVHREEPLDFVAEELVQRHQVGVDDSRGSAKLALQLADGPRRQATEDLDGDLRMPRPIERGKDLPHAAGSEPASDLEPAGERDACTNLAPCPRAGQLLCRPPELLEYVFALVRHGSFASPLDRTGTATASPRRGRALYG